MQVRALFFATYREIAGTHELVVELAPGASVRDLTQRLRGRGDDWLQLPADPAVAVNQVYASVDTSLREGDEVAFIPPVSGG